MTTPRHHSAAPDLHGALGTQRPTSIAPGAPAGRFVALFELSIPERHSVWLGRPSAPAPLVALRHLVNDARIASSASLRQHRPRNARSSVLKPDAALARGPRQPRCAVQRTRQRQRSRTVDAQSDAEGHTLPLMVSPLFNFPIKGLHAQADSASTTTQTLRACCSHFIAPG